MSIFVRLIARLLAPGFGMMLCACTSDRFESHYRTMTEAEQDGAIARGWIPAWVPVDASDLRELHDLDTNESLLRLALPESSQRNVPAACAATNWQTKISARLHAPWWPTSQQIANEFDLYDCAHEQHPGWLGVHRQQAMWIYWRVTRSPQPRASANGR